MPESWFEQFPVLRTLYLDNIWVLILVILLASMLLSFATNFFISRVLKRVTSKTKTDLDDHLIGVFRLPIRFTILGGGIYKALSLLLEHLYESTSETMPVWLTIGLFGAFGTLLIIVWVQSFVRFSVLVIDRVGDMEDSFSIVQPRTKPLFHMLAKIFFIALAGYLILTVWRQDVTGWVTSAGVLGLAVGFAARDTLANFFSGIFIIADAPYQLGDYVVLGNGERGQVTHIGIRSTRLLTRDDVEITIPNAIIGNTEIINQSGGPHEKFRVRIKVGVAYGSDVDHVCQLMEEIALNEPKVVEEPTPRVRFRAFGDSSLDFELLCWVEEPGARGLVTHILLTKIYKTFAAEDVEIPYPKRDVYLYRTDPPNGDGEATPNDPTAGGPAAGDPAAGDPAAGDPAAGDPAAGGPASDQPPS